MTCGEKDMEIEHFTKNILQEVRYAVLLPGRCPKLALISLPNPWEKWKM